MSNAELDHPLLTFKVEETELRRSQQSSRDAFNSWPNTPSPLPTRRKLSRFTVVIIDVGLSGLALLFAVLGILAWRAHGKPASSVSYTTGLISAARFGPTIFPILFALTVGRLMKNLAAFRIEKGVSIATLEQLLGSRAIGSTVITLISLRSCNAVGLLLIVLWTLSPFGGQASLRTASLESSAFVTPRTFQYLDWNTTWDDLGGLVDAEMRQIWTGLYTAALAGTPSVKRSPQDNWGNVKIPAIEMLPDFPASDTTEWLPIPNSSDVIYSSLLGLPVVSQSPVSNASYNVETFYMSLACSNMTVVNDSSSIVPPGWFATSWSLSGQIYTNTIVQRNLSDERLISFTSSRDDGEQVFWQCRLDTYFVEANISCVGKTCAAVAIRPSQRVPFISHWTVLDQPNVAWVFLGEFMNASQSNVPHISSGSQYYIVDPDNPFFNSSGYADFSQVDNKIFAARYTQLFNTYYLIQIAPFAVTGTVLPDTKESDEYEYKYKTSNALCGILSAVLSVLRRGPDIFDSYSSFTRDNEFMAKVVPSGGSNIDGMKRARYLKHVKVKLGDVAADQDVGHIAIGAVGAQEIKTLRRGRLYD